ncbi:MAG: hypothetical protein PHE97_05550 [Candidatus Omnitrophica bacterium]|nr:hypothetical protein [Candidatus Omnitrophota bacterium]
MKHKTLKNSYLEIEEVLKFYLFLMLFYALPLFAFSTRLMIFGARMPLLVSSIVHIGFIVFIYFLYLALRNKKKIGFWLSLSLHGLFLLNSFLLVFRNPAFLIIENLPKNENIINHTVVWGGVFVNILIIFCISNAKHRGYFVDNK